VAGFTYQPNQGSQSEDPQKPNYRHPDAPPLTGHFPNSWQTLSKMEREFRACIRTHAEQFQMVPIKLSDWFWAEEIAREGQRVVDDYDAQRRAWERKYLGKDAQGNIVPIPNAPAAPAIAPIRPRYQWGSMETLMVDIAWDHFTNDEIANHFRDWVKRMRPKDRRAPSGRGHKPKDLRANLTRLAAMRLLARFKPLDLIDPKRNKLPAIGETKQFSGGQWSDPTRWYDARREGQKVFRKLFPFLPENEVPLSCQKKEA